MLRWVSVAALVLAGVVTARWLLRREDALGRVRSFPAVAVVALLVTSAGAYVPVWRHDRLERRLEAVASELAGSEVHVHCQTAGEELLDIGAELGYVPFDADGVPQPRTLLKRGPCKHLSAYLGSDKSQPSLDEVVAVHVLAHESMHMAGFADEATTECRAVQRDALTATLLGADLQEAQQLARRYWREVYPRMPDDYRTGTCGPGGPLDEKLPDAPWTTTT